MKQVLVTTCHQRGCSFEPFTPTDGRNAPPCPVCGNPILAAELVEVEDPQQPSTSAAGSEPPPTASSEQPPQTPVDGHGIMGDVLPNAETLA